MDTPIQSNRTTRCNSLSNAPNSSCGFRCIPIAFDTPTSDSNRVAADSRDPSVTSSVRIRQILRDCRLKRWMSQVRRTLQTESPTLQPQNYATEADRVVRAGAMGMHCPPFARGRALPLVKRAKKRVRIFVAQKISGFIQLQRGMQ